MIIRVKFTREERVKYIGHLDIMRTFQRAFIRAGVRMVYSVGFNPHQKMNFAQPLGVGVTSSGEYMDVEIEDGQDLSLVMEGLRHQMGEGFSILSIRRTIEGGEKCMAAVEYASYTVTFANAADTPDIAAFAAAEVVPALKKTKSQESEVDLKKLVFRLEKNENEISFLVKGGSENNLKPDLLMQHIAALDGRDYDRDAYSVRRTGLYAEGFVPLEDYQTVE